MMDLLSGEILSHIFSYLDSTSLSRLSEVNRLFNSISKDDYLWKEHLYKNDVTVQLVSPPSRWKELYYVLRKNTFRGYQIIQKAVSCSSLDHIEQGPDKPLIPLDTRSRDYFYSSTGSADINSSEHLVYQFHQISVVKSVTIQPYKASYQTNRPTYAPLTWSISIGMDDTNMHWTSDLITIPNEHRTFTIDVTPNIIIGTHLKINLIGRHSDAIQPNDNLYYTVIEHLNCIGTPLACIDNTLLAISIVQFEVLCKKKQMKINENNKVIEIDEEQEKKEEQMYLNKYEEYKKDKNVMELIQNKNEKEIVMDKIKNNLKKGEIKESIKLMLTSMEYRCIDVFQLFVNEGNNVLMAYFQYLLKNPVIILTKYETIKLVEVLLTTTDKREITQRLMLIPLWLEQERITLSEELADLIRQYDVQIACSLYLSQPVPDKFIDCLCELKEYRKIVVYSRHYPINFISLIEKVMKISKQEAIKFAIVVHELQPNALNWNEVLGLFDVQAQNQDTLNVLRSLLQKLVNSNVQ